MSSSNTPETKLFYSRAERLQPVIPPGFLSYNFEGYRLPPRPANPFKTIDLFCAGFRALFPDPKRTVGVAELVGRESLLAQLWLKSASPRWYGGWVLELGIFFREHDAKIAMSTNCVHRPLLSPAVGQDVANEAP